MNILAKENPNSFARMLDFYEIWGKTNIVAEKSADSFATMFY